MFTELYGLPMIWNTIACLLVNECSWTKLQIEQTTRAHAYPPPLSPAKKKTTQVLENITFRYYYVLALFNLCRVS